MAKIFRKGDCDFQPNKGKIDGFRLMTDMSREKRGLNPKWLNFDIRLLNPKQYNAAYHFHRYAEEMFIIFSGKATLRTPEGLKQVETGDIIFFEAGELVDVQGVSKGKGFQGVIKRHGQHIGPKGHGSMYHRRPGSMGPTSSPGRVFPGKKLPGQTGKDTVTVQNLQVVKVDMDKEVILIKGSVPGYKNSLLRIKEAAKTPASKVTK